MAKTMAVSQSGSKMPMPSELSPNRGGGENDSDLKDEIPSVPLSTWKGQESRVAKVTTHFFNYFQTKPTFFVRVPGRVNLIGEHVDYCGYAVFPMAIEQDVFIAGRIASSAPNSAKLRLINTAEEYGNFDCFLKDIRDVLEGRKSGVSPQWHLYYLCGVLGVLEHLGLDSKGQSLEICVDGRVPPRAGLSSSSALVCAAALATVIPNQGRLGKKEMASLCAKSERYIGTQGGGMDQAIAFMATAGTAQKIDFLPQLSGEKVTLPETAVFVIANSLVEANKAASDGYNVRVAECRLATWVVAKRCGLPFLELEKVKQLQLLMGCGLREMVQLVRDHLHKEPYTAEEIAFELGLDVEELKRKPLMNRIPLQSVQLKLHQRITHVLQEAARVEEFGVVCKGPDFEGGRLARLGELMNGSHSSLRDLYECSHPQLDKLVALSQKLTLGARLTGAGWGGCMVALLEESQLQPYLDTLKREYYKALGIEDIGQHVFVTQPGAGATVFTN